MEPNAAKNIQTIPFRDVIIHGTYLDIILGIVIIYLITLKLAANKEAVDYISFAATLVSLTLALLAIYVGLSGNASLSALLGGARELNAQGIETQADLRSTGQKNLETARQLSDQVIQLSAYVTEMQGSINQKFENLGTTINKQAEPSQPSEILVSGISESSKALIRHFVSWSSIYGLMISYIVFRIEGTNIGYDRKKLGEFNTSLGGDYALGYLVASISSGIFLSTPGGAREPFLFLPTDKENLKLVKQEIISRISRDKERDLSLATTNAAILNSVKIYVDEQLGSVDETTF